MIIYCGDKINAEGEVLTEEKLAQLRKAAETQKKQREEGQKGK